MSCPWQNPFTAFARTLYWFIIYLFERLVNEKISIIISIILLYIKCLTMTMCIFERNLKKVFLGSESVVCVIPNWP